jgi:Raf kinase inhibitor-like YbhB/YbcL family protein
MTLRTFAMRWAGLLLRGRHAGDAALAWNDPRMQAVPATIELQSTAFVHGGAIPLRHAGEGVGPNHSPALQWRGLPPEAKHWVLLMEDPDVPLRHAFVHVLAWGSATLCGLAEGVLDSGRGAAGIVLGPNGLGVSGYAGPRPLPGHGMHRYVFQLFATDALPAPDLDRDALLDFLRAHAKARGRLDGLFERDWRARPVALGAPVQR